MADDDKIIEIIGAAETVEGLAQELPAFDGIRVYDRPWSGEPGTLDVGLYGPLASLQAEFTVAATEPFARRLAEIVQEQRIVLFDPATRTQTTLGRDTGTSDIVRLLRDDDQLSLS